ncbi:uncharacterized protein PHACADRAFT_97052, partial [Phanerochaete carnosa HHB-10118-sp]
YTTRELSTIFKHVSMLLPPPTTSTIDSDAIETTKLTAYNNRQFFHKQQTCALAAANTACNAHASASSSKLLANCLTTMPNYTPITSKLVTINFSKHTTTDLAHIFMLCFAATLKHFNVFETIELIDISSDDLKAIFKLCNHLAHLDCVLTYDKWKCYEGGF